MKECYVGNGKILKILIDLGRGGGAVGRRVLGKGRRSISGADAGFWRGGGPI